MKTFAELLRLIHNLIRIGTVQDVDVQRARCRVRIGDETSGWLPWICARAGKTRHWDPPTQGEQVVLLSPGGNLAAAIVVFGIYSKAYPAPSGDPDIAMMLLPDGAEFTYNHQNSELAINLPGRATITAPEGLTFKANTIVDGDFNVKGDTTFDGGSVQHQGKEIGKGHKHPINSGSSAPGPTGEVQ